MMITKLFDGSHRRCCYLRSLIFIRIVIYIEMYVYCVQYYTNTSCLMYSPYAFNMRVVRSCYARDTKRDRWKYLADTRTSIMYSSVTMFTLDSIEVYRGDMGKLNCIYIILSVCVCVCVCVYVYLYT
jgi:hypothetical protein